MSWLCNALRPEHFLCGWRKLPRSASCGAGLLAARTTTTVTGKPEGGQGMRLERLLTSGLAGPVSEATAMFYQVPQAHRLHVIAEQVHLYGGLSLYFVVVAVSCACKILVSVTPCCSVDTGLVIDAVPAAGRSQCLGVTLLRRTMGLCLW